tara:strand:- start:54 stop:647 length:594 start_codon:yes stop_codon:yes gene_type:complete
MMNLIKTCCIFATKNILDKKVIKYSFLFVFIAVFTISCSYLKGEKKEESSVVKKKPQITNMKERILAREDGGIFNSARQSVGGTTYEFATSNVLWRASLQSLEDVPIVSANYSGGILISDWINSSEAGSFYKIQVNFKSNELAVTSLDIKTFLKKCSSNNTKCKLSKGSSKTNSEIKSKILNIARSLKIEDDKKKKK